MAEKINEEAKKQIKNYFRQSRYLFFTFLIGLVLFLITAYIVIYFQDALNPEYEKYLIFGAPLSGAALVLMSYRLFIGRVNVAKTAEKLYEKMESYRSGMVLRYILLDGAAFIQMISYIMTGNKLYLALCVVIMSLFFTVRPSIERFIKEMELNDLESKVMRDHYHA